MKLIKPSFEILEQGPGLDGIYEAIERAGRTCYKSKRPEGQAAKDFVDRMIASQHYAMLEHGTVYLRDRRNLEYENNTELVEYPHTLDKYSTNPYSKVRYTSDCIYVTTNYRVIVENNWLDDLKYLCEPTEYHEKRVTVRFICDRGVSHELVRHRVFSFAQESTRYCNYSKDKFGNELTFIIPSCGYKTLAIYNGVDEFEGDYFEHFLRDSEYYYFKLLELGWTPQQARQVLPNALKTEVVMTGYDSDWKHFFDLRALGTTGKPHPDMQALAKPLMDEFKKRDWI